MIRLIRSRLTAREPIGPEVEYLKFVFRIDAVPEEAGSMNADRDDFFPAERGGLSSPTQPGWLAGAPFKPVCDPALARRSEASPGGQR